MNSKRGFAGLVLACVACCAPLLVPLLAGTGAALGLATVSLDAALCIGVPALALVSGGVWLVLRMSNRSSCGCKNNCDTASSCG